MAMGYRLRPIHNRTRGKKVIAHMNETKNCQTKCRMAPNPPTLALLALATALALAGCKKEAPAPPPPPVVQVMEITATNAPRDTEVIGQLDSPQNVEVRARVEAFVEKVLFVEGTEIKEGASSPR